MKDGFVDNDFRTGGVGIILSADDEDNLVLEQVEYESWWCSVSG